MVEKIQKLVYGMSFFEMGRWNLNRAATKFLNGRDDGSLNLMN